MKDIKLVALDLDGTLFDNSSRISERNLTAIRSITDKGIHVVISTGRPFEGIPFDQIKGTGINYAITANGSGIYEISTGKCLYENAMDEELVTPILNFLLTRDIHMDAFIGGKGYTPGPVRRNGTKTDRAFFDQKLYYHHTHTAGQYPAVYP